MGDGIGDKIQPDPSSPPRGTNGAPAAPLSALFNEVYQELRALARQRMAAERNDHTLQPTALVHEAFLRLQGSRGIKLEGRAQFFRAAADAMRRILVEHARARRRLKRGGAAGRAAVDVGELADLMGASGNPDQVLAFDEAICRLEEHTPQIAAVVRLRFYAGLGVDETAEALEISPRSVDRAWAYARTWLYRELEGEAPADGQAGKDAGPPAG